MAIDTRTKRASILGLAFAANLTLPLADGTIGQADRQHIAYVYPGISAAAAQVASADVIVRVPSQDAIVRVQPDDVSVRIPPDVVIAEVEAADYVVRIPPDDPQVIM